MVRPGRLDLLAHKVLPGWMVRPVRLEDHKVLLVQLAPLVRREYKVTQDPKDPKDCKVQQAHPGRKVQQVRKVSKGSPVQMGKLDPLGRKATQVHKARREFRGLQVHKEFKG